MSNVEPATADVGHHGADRAPRLLTSPRHIDHAKNAEKIRFEALALVERDRRSVGVTKGRLHGVIFAPQKALHVCPPRT